MRIPRPRTKHAQITSGPLRISTLAWILGLGCVGGLVDHGSQAMASESFIDRTTCFLPRPAERSSSLRDSKPTPPAEPPAVRLPFQFESFQQALDDKTREAWRAYMRVWQAHHDQPADEAIRQFLGLPLTRALPIRSRPPTSAPSWLAWRRGSYAQWESPHFQVFTKAGEQDTRRIVSDLENTYWVWTQLFFPLWKQNARLAGMLEGLDDTKNVSEFLRAGANRIPTSSRLRVVIFADARQYQSALADSVPGIEQSTGFYGDQRKTMFLYADSQDDPATRRHELTHQLFREATLSRLRRSMPGTRGGFWLIEGIAGYMESLHFEEYRASVGGWDSPRLQYARYRVFATNDFFPPDQLRDGSIDQVQQLADLPRWYAHSIMQTHWMMDHSVSSRDHRAWLYGELAKLYQIQTPKIQVKRSPELTLASMKQFLSVDDQTIRNNAPRAHLKELCLIACEVSSDGLSHLPPQDSIRWLDLSRLPISNQDVQRIVTNPGSLRQLSLEATAVDGGLAAWLVQARQLTELDLSWTKVDDTIAPAIAKLRGLQTLWLTGSLVADRTAAMSASLPSLTAIDLQRTQISAAGLQRLKSVGRNLRVNPLQLVEAEN